MTWLWQLAGFGLGVSSALVTYRIWRRQNSPAHWVGRGIAVSAALLAVLTMHAAWHGAASARAAERQRASVRSRGAHAFQELGCANCHSLGGGVVVGPDLRTAAGKYDHDLLVQWIESPESVYSARHQRPLNPGFSEMPDLGVQGNDAEAIAEYLAAAGERHP